MQLQNKVHNTTFFGNYSFKTPIQPETQKLIETERWRVFLVSYFTFCKLMSWKEGLWNFLSRKKSVLLNGVRSICLSPLSLYVSFTSLFLTPCAPSRSFHRVCVSQGLFEEKKGKEIQEGTHNCQAPLIETARSFWRVREEGRERDALWHVCLTPAVCVCVCV